MNFFLSFFHSKLIYDETREESVFVVIAAYCFCWMGGTASKHLDRKLFYYWNVFSETNIIHESSRNFAWFTKLKSISHHTKLILLTSWQKLKYFFLFTNLFNWDASLRNNTHRRVSNFLLLFRIHCYKCKK